MPTSSPSVAAPERPVLLLAHPEFSRARVHGFGATLGLVASLDLVTAILIAMGGGLVRHGLNVPPGDFLWILTAYAAAAVLANLMLVQVAARIGLRRFTLIGLGLYALGAVGCALSGSLSMLIAARALQGLGGGGLFAASRLLAQVVSRPQERLSLFWGFGLANFGLLALMPWLAASFTENHGWRALFWMQAALALPLAPLVATIYPRRLPSRAGMPLGHLDWPGVLAFGVAALLLMHALEHLRYLSWAEAPALLGYGLAGVALAVVMFRRFHAHPDPWLDPRRLASRRYLTGLAFYGLFYLLTGYWNSVFPAVLVEGLGLSFTSMGALLSAGGLATLASLIAFHLLLPRIARKRRYITLGYVMLAGALTWIALLARPGASATTLLPAVLLHGLTPVLVLLQVAMMTFVDMPLEDFAHAYAFKSIVREVVNALGTGVAVLQLHQLSTQAEARLQAAAPVELLPQLADTLQRTAVLDAGAQILSGLALGCLVLAALAAWQRSLR